MIRCYSYDIQDVLDDLPEDLDEKYERILRNIDNQKRKYAQRLFQCLLVSIRPFYVEELTAILSVQFDTTAPHIVQEAFSASGCKRIGVVHMLQPDHDNQ